MREGCTHRVKKLDDVRDLQELGHNIKAAVQRVRCSCCLCLHIFPGIQPPVLQDMVDMHHLQYWLAIGAPRGISDPLAPTFFSAIGDCLALPYMFTFMAGLATSGGLRNSSVQRSMSC